MIRPVTILTTFLFAINLSAEVNFTPQKNIFITGANCAEIQAHARDIMEWTRSRNELSDETKMPDCYCSDSQCHMDVFTLSPQFVKNNTNFKGAYSYATGYDGPNCFNAALSITKTVDQIRFVHPKEMTFLLNSSLCRQKTLEEPLQAGDIIAIRNTAHPNYEHHAATYINEELSFSKYGVSRSTAYSYGIDVFSTYNITKNECKRIYGDPEPGSPCFMRFYANYYTCQPLYRYVSQITQNDGIAKDIKNLYPTITRIDRYISKAAYNGIRIEKEDIKMGREQIRTLKSALVEILARASLTTNEREFAGILKVRLISLYSQLYKIAKALGHESLFPDVKEDA